MVLSFVSRCIYATGHCWGLVGAFALKLFPLVPSFSVSLLLIRRRVNKDADGSIVGGKT